MSRSRDGEKEKDLRVSSNDGSMACLKHVPVQRVGSYLVKGWPVKIGQAVRKQTLTDFLWDSGNDDHFCFHGGGTFCFRGL